MKQLIRVIPAACVLCLCLVHVSSVFCDEYDPPGPPRSEAAKMKTLNQIEPRTLISQLPYTIDESGSYYLIQNLTMTNTVPTNGISINADDVRLDLRGFSLIGGSNSNHGVFVDYRDSDPWQYFNITIHNGIIRGWGGDGINAAEADECQVIDVKVIDNDGYGMIIGPNSLVEQCSIRGNGSCGLEIWSGGTVTDCKTRGNGRIGPYNEGIYANQGSKITGCTANDNSIGIWANSYCTVRDCTVLWNDTDGIRVGNSCRIEDNNCGNNAFGGGYGAGIHVQGTGNRIEGNNVTDNYQGIYVDQGEGGGRNLIVRNSASGNNWASYDTSTNDYYGSVMDTNTMGTTGFTGDPWANFEF